MATQKVLYFTAGPVATAGELADIAALNAAALPAYEIGVRSGDTARVKGEYGEGRLEPATYIAGTPPAAYTNAEDEDENPIYTVLDPDNLPAPPLPDDQAVVTDEDTLEVTQGTVTFSVAGNVLTGAFAAGGDYAFVEDGVAVPVTGGTVTFTVVDGAITGGTYAPA